MKVLIVLAVLVGFALILSIVDSFVIFNINSKLNILGNVILENNNPSNKPSGQNEQQEPSKVKVSEGSHVQGSKDAPVTIIEFSDFQCPYCGRFYSQTLPQIEEEYIKTGKVKLVYRHCPLSFHQYAQKASEAAECADEQGKFWEYHDKLYENQNSLDAASLKKYAKELGLDTAKFDSCMDSGKTASKVQKDFKDGQAAGVQGTPAFFINGVPVTGAQPYEVFKQVIEQELKK